MRVSYLEEGNILYVLNGEDAHQETIPRSSDLSKYTHLFELKLQVGQRKEDSWSGPKLFNSEHFVIFFFLPY